MSCVARSLVRSALCCLRGVLSLHGMLLSIGLGFTHPCGQLVGLIALIAPDVLRHMRSEYLGRSHPRSRLYVPREVREKLFTACNSPDVDASWLLWKREAEASLARAYLSAGAPPLESL